MKLYHGSNVEVREPKILISNRNLDFGSGFYTTSSINQASSWAKRQKERKKIGKATVTIYEWDEEKAKNLKILNFKKASQEWLDFVAENRKGTYNGKLYDIVIGPVANDRTIFAITGYMNNELDAETTLLMLKPQVLEDQYVFLTKKALNTLKTKEVKKL